MVRRTVVARRRGYANYRTYSLVAVIYVLIGIVVAFDREYITVDLLKRVFSALLAIALWFLVLLGVDLRIS
jgi:hypothetical protein